MPTVNEIRSFPFNEEGLEQVRETRDGKNWPVVYLIHDNALIKQWLWCDIVKGYVFYKTDFLVIHMIVVTCIIFIVCSVLELFRIKYVE